MIRVEEKAINRSRLRSVGRGLRRGNARLEIDLSESRRRFPEGNMFVNDVFLKTSKGNWAYYSTVILKPEDEPNS